VSKWILSIPVKRAILYLLVIGLFPSFLVLFYFFSEKGAIQTLEKRIQALEEMAYLKQKRGELNKSIMVTYSGSDKFYIDKELESLQLLLPEIETLEKSVQTFTAIDNESLHERLSFLKNTNKIVFAESNVQNLGGFTETTESLVKPVELDMADLQTLLTRIEKGENFDETSKKPQLIITDFRMDRAPTLTGSEVFRINLKLLKREFQQ